MNSEDSACIRDAALSHISNVGNELYEAAEKLNSYAVAYKLIPFRDGNQWCVLLGDDLQVGIAGFGDTPAKAIADFDRSMNAPVKQCLTTDTKQTAAPDDVARDAMLWRGIKTRIIYDVHGDGMAWATMNWCVEVASMAPDSIEEAILSTTEGRKDE